MLDTRCSIIVSPTFYVGLNQGRQRTDDPDESGSRCIGTSLRSASLCSVSRCSRFLGVWVKACVEGVVRGQAAWVESKSCNIG